LVCGIKVLGCGEGEYKCSTFFKISVISTNKSLPYFHVLLRNTSTPSTMTTATTQPP
jgi:hypothetical protein